MWSLTGNLAATAGGEPEPNIQSEDQMNPEMNPTGVMVMPVVSKIGVVVVAVSHDTPGVIRRNVPDDGRNAIVPVMVMDDPVRIVTNDHPPAAMMSLGFDEGRQGDRRDNQRNRAPPEHSLYAFPLHLSLLSPLFIDSISSRPSVRQEAYQTDIGAHNISQDTSYKIHKYILFNVLRWYKGVISMEGHCCFRRVENR